MVVEELCAKEEEACQAKAAGMALQDGFIFMILGLIVVQEMG